MHLVKCVWERLNNISIYNVGLMFKIEVVLIKCKQMDYFLFFITEIT